jgi:hypothetical protein
MIGFLKRIGSEPLVQFGLIGLALYAVSAAVSPERDDPRLIVVDGDVHRHLASVFQTERDRPPSAEEMDHLVERYVMNETLVREARTLRLDWGDEMVRERLIQRIRLMMYSGIAVDPPSDEVLRPWFESRAERYVIPGELTFRVIGLDSDEKTAAEAEAAAMNADAGHAPSGPKVAFRDRPRSQMTKLFGDAFIAAVEAAEPGVWTPVSSPKGWQVVQLDGFTEDQPQSFDQAKNAARADWSQERVQIEARAALDALMARYPVKRLPYDPALLAAQAAQ